jgi:hypothetical protein
MQSNPKKYETKLNNLIDAWGRIDPEAVFAGFTLEAFKEKVQASFSARAMLKEIRLDFSKWVMDRSEADEVSMDEYFRTIHGIRCHVDHGNNSAILRACGYVTEMERDSGLTRAANNEGA